MLRALWNTLTYRAGASGPDLVGRSMAAEFGPPHRSRHRELVDSLGPPSELRAYVTRADRGPLAACWVAVWRSPRRKEV